LSQSHHTQKKDQYGLREKWESRDDIKSVWLEQLSTMSLWELKKREQRGSTNGTEEFVKWIHQVDT
jgi:hypothetical protein